MAGGLPSFGRASTTSFSFFSFLPGRHRVGIGFSVACYPMWTALNLVLPGFPGLYLVSTGFRLGFDWV